MQKNREGYYVGDFDRECTKCGKLFSKTSRTVTLCNSCNSERVKCTSPENKMYARAKSRAKAKGLDFNIEKSDINIPKLCPILGIELKCDEGKPGGNDNSPALDRIIPSKGYTKGNVWVISQLANMMKHNANDEMLIIFANWVLENIKNNGSKI
jgi:hypothetical protein